MVVQALEILGQSIWYPLKSFFIGVVNFVPQLLGAIIVLVFGYFIGDLVQKLAYKLLHWLKVDKDLRFKKYHGFTKSMSIEKTASVIAKWYVFLLFVQVALPLLNLGALQSVVISFVLWVPNLLAGIIVILVGLYIADYVGKELTHVRNKVRSKLAELFRYILAFVFILVGLDQIGIQVQIVQNTWLIMFAGVSLAFALAIGIGFGLALKDHAFDFIKEVKTKYNSDEEKSE